VYYVGAATGRDGLGGAAFASKELSAESASDRPAVQKGDPFMEKLLIEACLEMMAVPGLVVGIQDMGAAGLTCSTCETASRGGAGIEIELDRVPQRETGMNSYEIMLSESQERMLVIVQKGREREIEEVFAKWDLHAANVGTVTDTGRMVVTQHGVVVADIPASALTDNAPVYQREAGARLPGRDLGLDARGGSGCPTSTWGAPGRASEAPLAPDDRLQALDLPPVRPHGAARHGRPARQRRRRRAAAARQGREVHRDQQRLQRPVLLPEPQARGPDRDGGVPAQPRLRGGDAAGDDRQPQLRQPLQARELLPARECVAGLAEACRFFDVPVVGGNVSLYNESPEGAIDPTPTVSVVGFIEDEAHVTRQFARPGERLILLGGAPDELGGSQFLGLVHGLKTGDAPAWTWRPRSACRTSSLGRSGRAASGGPRPERGRAPGGGRRDALRARGAPGHSRRRLDLGPAAPRLDALLFGESQGRVVVAVDAGRRGRRPRPRRRGGRPRPRSARSPPADALRRDGPGGSSWPVAELRRAGKRVLSRP
jgi:phosphoribosylformylglycinamidine synthase subunit PurL